jgi:hypothetical protein
MAFFVLIFFLIPAVLLGGLIWLSVRPSSKPWLKPFFSHHDFHKQIMSLTAIGLFITFWVSLYALITRNNPDLVSWNQSSWFTEIWFLLFGLISLLIALLTKSYTSLAFSYIYGLVFVIVEIVKWGVDSRTFGTGGGSSMIDYVSPLALLGFSWILINISYFIGKFVSNGKNLARFGNSLRTVMIFANTAILGLLSSSFILKTSLGSVVGGKLFFDSIPLMFVALFCLVLSGYSIFYRKKIQLGLEEILVSILPAWLIVLISLLYTQKPNDMSYNGFGLSDNYAPDSVIWNIFFTVLNLSYVMFLVYKGGQTHEKWLKVYSVILLILVVLGKFIDTSVNLGFNGIFLTIFGLMVLFIGGVLEYFRRKSPKN